MIVVPERLGIPLADAARFDLHARSRVWIPTLWIDGRGIVIHDPSGATYDRTRCGTATVYRYADGFLSPRGHYRQLVALNPRRVRLCRRCYRGATLPVDVARLDGTDLL